MSANKIAEQTLDQISTYTIDANPTTAGFTASTGSLAVFNGDIFIKTNTADTDWQLITNILQSRKLAYYHGF